MLAIGTFSHGPAQIYSDIEDEKYVPFRCIKLKKYPEQSLFLSEETLHQFSLIMNEEKKP